MLTDNKNNSVSKTEAKQNYDKILNAIFMPAAITTGEHLGNFVNKVFEGKYAETLKRQKQNLRLHLEAHAKNLTEKAITEKIDPKTLADEKFSRKNLVRYYEWAEVAKDIDPENPDQKNLTALWQDILFRMSEEKPLNSDLFQILKVLRDDEVAFLLKFQKYIYFGIGIKGYKKGEHLAKDQLVKFGLIENITFKDLYRPMLKSPRENKGIIVHLVTVALATLDIIFPFFFKLHSLLPYTVIGVALLSSLFALAPVFKEDHWKLSVTGKKMLGCAPEN